MDFGDWIDCADLIKEWHLIDFLDWRESNVLKEPQDLNDVCECDDVGAVEVNIDIDWQQPTLGKDVSRLFHWQIYI